MIEGSIFYEGRYIKGRYYLGIRFFLKLIATNVLATLRFHICFVCVSLLQHQHISVVYIFHHLPKNFNKSCLSRYDTQTNLSLSFREQLNQM